MHASCEMFFQLSIEKHQVLFVRESIYCVCCTYFCVPGRRLRFVSIVMKVAIAGLVFMMTVEYDGI